MNPKPSHYPAGVLLAFSLAFAGIALGVSAIPACTPAERATAGTVLSAVGQGAPVACAAIAGLTGSVCPDNVGNDVSAVAQLVAAILASLPPAMHAAMGAALKTFVYQGARVTLPSAQADAVWVALQARDGGT